MGNASTDRLIFDSDQSGNLTYFSFTGYTSAAQFNLGGGFYEVVAVPNHPLLSRARLLFHSWGSGIFVARAVVSPPNSPSDLVNFGPCSVLSRRGPLSRQPAMNE